MIPMPNDLSFCLVPQALHSTDTTPWNAQFSVSHSHFHFSVGCLKRKINEKGKNTEKSDSRFR